MRDCLNLKILSPAEIAFSGSVKSVKVPGALGQMEVFPNHTALVSSLLPGQVMIRQEDGKEESYFINGGYIQINHDVTLIVDDLFEASSLDRDYFIQKKDLLSQRLLQSISDEEYEKITSSIAIYQQLAA